MLFHGNVFTPICRKIFIQHFRKKLYILHKLYIFCITIDFFLTMCYNSKKDINWRFFYATYKYKNVKR